MTDAEKLALQAEVAANPHLHSARHNKDVKTITSVLNETRDVKAKLSYDDVLAAVLFRPPVAEKSPETPKQ